MGVIDALGDGYRIVVRRPYLIAIPVLLDLIIWLLPPISVPGPNPAGVGSDSLGPSSAALEIEISWLLGLFVPSIAPLGGDLDAGKSPIELIAFGSIAGAIILLVSGSAIVASIYLALVANVVNVSGDRFDLIQVLADKSPKLLGLVLGGTAIAVATFGLVLVVAFLLGSAASALPGVLVVPVSLLLMASLFAGLVGLLAAGLVMYIAILALILEPLSVRASIRSSVNFLQVNRLPTIVFVSLTFFIQIGLGFIWMRLSSVTPGFVVSVLGSAFIGTVISAASMVFYLSRLPKPETIAGNGIAA